MTESRQSAQTDLSGVVSNEYGEHYLFGVNGNVFQTADASSVFRSYYGDSLFKENTFYIIAGTDSGLLFQFIKAQGVPKKSRYLFVELPQVLDCLVELDDPEGELAITTLDKWIEQASTMDLSAYAIQNQLVLIRSLGVVHGHYSEYLPFWRKLREQYDGLTKQYAVGLNHRPFTLRQLENLTENEVPAIFLENTFIGKTAVLLSGGPSLDELLPWVKRKRKDLLVIAVSRISHSLVDADIQPDICVSVDPYDINLKVSREMLEFQNGTLLVNEFHLSSNLLSSWAGKKAFMGRRYPWSSPLEVDNIPTSPGTTVTNSAFSIAVEAGVTQLVLCGADFCFSQRGYTHASGSAEHAAGPRLMYGDARVETNSGTMADTTSSYLNSAKTIDLQAAEAVARGCRVINPAPGAARLPHIEHVPLGSIQIEPLEKTAQEIIEANLPTIDANTRIRFYKEVLTETDRVLSELRTVKDKANKALNHNHNLFNKKDMASSYRSNAKIDHIEKQFSGKYASTVKLIKYYGVCSLLPILQRDGQEQEDLKENNRLYYQTVVKTADELVTLLQKTRSRILNRLEEENPQPDLQRLIEQWRRDKQPGRAIQWARNHPDAVNLLTDAQRRSLQSFQDTFDGSIDELSKHNLNRIEKVEDTLTGLNARAREFFQCRDATGLKTLLVGLEEHRDMEQAALYLSLVQGYLAELQDDPNKAIAAYQSISDGPTHIDALMRLFELHSKTQDWPPALEVLKTLSEISAIYSPMYADLLQATGDVNKAVEIYTDYLLANPDDLNSVMKLGKIYHQHDSREGVEWAMTYILDKDPENQAAKALLNSLNQQTHLNS